MLRAPPPLSLWVGVFMWILVLTSLLLHLPVCAPVPGSSMISRRILMAAWEKNAARESWKDLHPHSELYTYPFLSPNHPSFHATNLDPPWAIVVFRLHLPNVLDLFWGFETPACWFCWNIRCYVVPMYTLLFIELFLRAIVRSPQITGSILEL